MKIKRWLSLLLACVMAVGLLAGCGNDSSTTSSDNPDKTDDPGNTNAGVLDTQDSTQQLVSKDVAIIDDSKPMSNYSSAQRSVFNIGTTADCLDFDPFTYNTGADHFTGIYQSLALMNNGEPYGIIAKSIDESDDGMTIKIEIYDYITDSDGNNITASDVKFSFDKSNELARLGMDAYVEEFEITGDYTMTLHMAKPLGIGKMDKLVMFHIVSEKAYAEHDMHTDPVGTGPYKLKEHISGYCTTVELREDYWQTDDKNLPRDGGYVDQINTYVISESAQITIALKNGTIDHSRNVPSEDLEYFENSDDYRVAALADDISYTLFPNCDPSRLTSDVNLRNALFYSVNSEAILQSVFGGRGTTQHSKAPSWSVGYNDEWDKEDNYYVTNVETAKDYLAKSSYKGEELILLTEAGSPYADIAQMLVAMWADIGITVKLNAVDGTIVKSTYKDKDAWDLYLYRTATNTYWIDSVNGAFTDDKTEWYGSENFWYEEELQDLLTLCMATETATTENFNTLRSYVIDNALCMSIVNGMVYYVLPSDTTGICVNRWKYLVPGGSTYAE